MLALDISTLCSLHELVAIVLVSHLQMVKSRLHSFDLFFALFVLCVELIAIALKLFLFLGGFYNIVDLRMLADALSLTGRGLVLLNKSFEFDS